MCVSPSNCMASAYDPRPFYAAARSFRLESSVDAKRWGVQEKANVAADETSMKFCGPRTTMRSISRAKPDRIGRIGHRAQAMVARQPSDQAELLGQHGPTGARCPQQDAARADEALVGRQHDVAARHQDVEFGAVQPPVLDAQPQFGPFARQRSSGARRWPVANRRDRCGRRTATATRAAMCVGSSRKASSTSNGPLRSVK